MNKPHKKIVTILVLLLTIVTFSSAQKSPYYTKSVVINKVYPHKLGFVVYYMSNDLETKSVYIPHTLFQQQESSEKERSKLFQGYNKAYPYMTIFWKDGVFSHIKLYLKEGYNDYTWGALSNPDALDENFKNTDLKFDF